MAVVVSIQGLEFDAGGDRCVDRGGLVVVVGVVDGRLAGGAVSQRQALVPGVVGGRAEVRRRVSAGRAVTRG